MCLLHRASVKNKSFFNNPVGIVQKYSNATLNLFIMATKKKNSILAASTFIEGPDQNITLNPRFPVGTGRRWVETAYVADVSRWGEVAPGVTLHALFVNHFNTDIKGETGWTVGYLNETNVPITTDLDDIVYSGAGTGQKNIQGNYHAIVGQNNTIGWTNGGNEGYYKGSVSTHDFEIYRIVVITNGTTYVLIKVTNQGVESANGNQLWGSKIEFEYNVVSSVSTAWDDNNPKHQLLKDWMGIK